MDEERFWSYYWIFRVTKSTFRERAPVFSVIFWWVTKVKNIGLPCIADKNILIDIIKELTKKNMMNRKGTLSNKNGTYQSNSSFILFI